MTHEERMKRAIRFNQERKAGAFASQVATRDRLLLDELSSEEINQLVSIYPAWETLIGDYLADGTEEEKTQAIVSHKGELWKVIDGHTAQADWEPDVADSLFVSFTPEGTIAEWTQPVGGHDAYDTGDKVIYEGTVYRSTIDGNTWSPAEHPEGWEEVSE